MKIKPLKALAAIYRLVLALVTGRPLFVSSAEEIRRFDTCKRCPHFVVNEERCGICSCYMVMKTVLATERCPLGKWGKERVETRF